MPIYEFICQECGAPFETLVMGFSTENVTCPRCNSKDIKKQVSSFAVKGSASNNAFSTSSPSCGTGST